MRRVFILPLVFAGAALAGPELPIGRVDTIGWTTYDWQNAGPALRTLCNAPAFGLHATWTFSATTPPFPDRNMRYNFYGYPSGMWLSDSGINVFAERAGLGNLACDPSSGVALVSTDAGSPPRPIVARDAAPGAGIFEYGDGPQGYIWPVIDAGQNRWIHAAVIDDASRDGLWNSRCTTWCQWSQPVHISAGSDPMFPSHNITASKVSRKVCLAWVIVESGRYPAYYSISTDRGTTWPPPTQLPWPPAFSGDTLSSFHLGVFPFYDRQDRLHIVAEVMPIVHDTGYVNPVEIWHWSPENTPQWTEIHRAGCAPEHVMAPVGYNAIYAGRPSIGEDRNGGLYVAWEQFDSLNYEPQTDRLRADIWYARDNCDNGASWQAGIRITDPDQSSKRFPCVTDLLARDTLCMTYEIDLVAGFYVMGEQPGTNNPVVAQFVPVTVSGLGMQTESVVPKPGLSVTPSPSSGAVNVRFSAPPGQVDFRVFNFSGRLVFSTGPLVHLTAGPLPLDLRGLPNGVYLVRLTTASGSYSTKLVLR